MGTGEEGVIYTQGFRARYSVCNTERARTWLLHFQSVLCPF